MNNRQANGRRRGRGGQQQQRSGGGSGQRDNGNRIDNRARGNAAQLLEKYKNLARDAQMQGDRVNTEYYLQFADHYFRVLSETRARFEENNPGQQHQQRRITTDLDEEEFGDTPNEASNDEGNREERQDRDNREPRQDREPRQSRDDREARQPRQDREPRQPREDREARQPREDREPRQSREDREPRQSREDREARQPREDREPRQPREEGRRDSRPNMSNGQYRTEDQGVVAEPAVEVREEEAQAPRRRGRPRREEVSEESSGLDLAVLPPAISIEPAAEEAAEEKPRRRGRPRRDADVPAA